jgi:hypothetical protein
MVRRLLSVLLVVPLLLPQGMCVCDLLQKCEACAATENSTPATAKRPTCSCCKKHREKHASTAVDRAHTCHRSSPADKQDHHAPGCPAKAGGGHWNFNLTHTSSLLPLLASASLALHPAPAPLNWGLTSDGASIDRLLHVTQVNLRI